MIPMDQLKDRQGYHGTCRNARLAIWYADIKRFAYPRSDFGGVSRETLRHLEDPALDQYTDGFAPEREATRDEVVKRFGEAYVWDYDNYAKFQAERDAEKGAKA